MEEIVRPYAAPEKGPGFKAKSTEGLNPDAPEFLLGGGRQSDIDPFARTDTETDFRRWTQFSMRLADAEEVESVGRVVSGAVEIDLRGPNLVRLNVSGSSLSITFSAFPALPAGHERSILHQALRVRTIEVKIAWLGSGARTVTAAGVLWPGGAGDLEWSEEASIDVVMFQISSDGQKLGFPVGRNMRA